MTTPTPPEDGAGFGPPLEPPPSPGPWASDNLPPNPLANVAPRIVERPKSIRRAVTLMYVGAGLAVLQVLITLLLSGSIRDRLRDDNPDFTDSEVNTAANSILAFAVVVGVVSVGLWLWMASQNGQGKSWARVVATVFGALGILFTLLSFLGGGAGSLLGLVGLVLAIWILVLLYQRDSSAYYDARSRTY